MKHTLERWEITCAKRIRKSERYVPHSYRDQKGILTFGFGHNLNNHLTPIEMCIVTRYLDEKEFNAFRDDGYFPFYPENSEATFNHLTSPFQVADFLFYQDFHGAGFQVSLEFAEFGVTGFNGLPYPAKIALVDMCYNMGINRLTGFEKMKEALVERDWDKVSAECLDSNYGRDKISKVRAKSNADLFLSCKEIVDRDEPATGWASENKEA